MDILWLFYVLSVWLVALAVFVIVVGFLFLYIMEKVDDWRR